MITNNFSFFGRGYQNKKSKWVLQTKPQGTMSITQVYEFIISDCAREATMRLRAMLQTTTKEQRQDYKKANFTFVTFSGSFLYRNATSLIMRTPYMVLDIDDLSSIDEARDVQYALCADTQIETALCFVSPSGLGVKWVLELPEWTQGLPFLSQWYKLRNHLAFHYGLKADPSGKDVNRACYLPWDNECFINNKYLSI